MDLIALIVAKIIRIFTKEKNDDGNKNNILAQITVAHIFIIAEYFITCLPNAKLSARSQADKETVIIIVIIII